MANDNANITGTIFAIVAIFALIALVYVAIQSMQASGARTEGNIVPDVEINTDGGTTGTPDSDY